MCSKQKDKISIAAPLTGQWKFLRPPGHHPFAFDFVKTDAGGRKTHNKTLLHFIFNKISAENYFCWEEPVFSPISGKVIRVANDWHDHKYTNLWNAIKIWYNATYKFRPVVENGILDIRPNAGNHVMIQSDTGYIVFLAHLKNNSIKVKQGQQVKQGEQLGLIGNSGNSTAPHLHINLFDQMDDPFTAEVLPFIFNEYTYLNSKGLWTHCIGSVPKVGSLIKF